MGHVIAKPNRFIKPRFEWRPRHNPDHPLSQGIVGHWLFNEGVGNRVYDMSEFRNHGLLENFGFSSGSGWEAGQYGTALRFDGTNDFVSAGTTLNMRLNDWSVSVWFKTTDTELCLVAKSLYGASTGRWAVIYTTGALKTLFTDNSGNGVVASWTTTSILDDKWHHVVGVWDRDGYMVLYCDGILRGSYDISPYSTIDSNTNYYLLFGKYNDTSGGKTGTYYQFAGSMDDIRIYRRALSPQDVTRLYYDPFCDLEVPTCRRYFFMPTVSFNPAWAKQSNVTIVNGITM